MEVLTAILAWSLFGLIVGALARLLVPGRQNIGLGMTILLGIAGSFVGGFLGWVFTGGDPLRPSGWLLSIVGAVVLLGLYAYRKRRRAGA